ncbi:MAG: 16S rRNA (guanine(527)-N(7))-methyltransferase RsmG [Burkholderiales bacterium]|nr:16S rRNA (guanine(527)-N(7))-methyltransferase RsmG [Burkholderiales bacterium]
MSTGQDARALLEQGFAALGLQAQDTAVERLLAYVELLVKWNRVYNLTAIDTPARIVTHHLLDSLAILPHLTATRLLDVGSGAGLPGLPLAVMRPQLEVTLLEASQKKAAFLQQAVITLALANVQVVCARAEDWQGPAPFAGIVSRAFSDLEAFVRATRHLLAPGGRWLAMKGVRPQAELAALRSARVVQVHRLQVPGLAAERHLVVLEALA